MIFDRLVKVYGYTPNRKRKIKMLGLAYLHRRFGQSRMKLPKRILERGETYHYRLFLSDDYSREHYMEELRIQIGNERRNRELIYLQVEEVVDFEWKLSNSFLKETEFSHSTLRTIC